MIGTTAIGWGDADDKESRSALLRSAEVGINFFETADIYGLGHSEELIGEVLGNRQDIILATKVGNVSRNDQFTVGYLKEYILKSCDESLKRLKRDFVDYYQLHAARLSHLQEGDCFEAVEQLRQQGKIRYWGTSLDTFDPFSGSTIFMQQQLGHGFQMVLKAA